VIVVHTSETLDQLDCESRAQSLQDFVFGTREAPEVELPHEHAPKSSAAERVDEEDSVAGNPGRFVQTSSEGLLGEMVGHLDHESQICDTILEGESSGVTANCQTTEIAR
jgi:hypothetical protein